MFARVAIILAAVLGSAAAARAADFAVDGGFVDCDCGSEMIVIYDSEPGVITRQWKSDCDCRYVPDRRRPYRMAAPAGPRYESLRDPWRR